MCTKLGLVTLLLFLSWGYSAEARPSHCDCSCTWHHSRAQEVCENNFRILGCDAYLERHPEVEDRLSCCPKTTSPPETRWADYFKGCAQGLKEMGVDTVTSLPSLAMAIFGDHKLSDDDLSRLDFLRDCKDPLCKRQILGQFEDLFTDEEISGKKPINPDINCDDPAAQNVCFGYSATTLYRLMIERVAKKVTPQNRHDLWTQPWTGKTESLGELTKPTHVFDDLLENKWTCYDDKHKADMVCYTVAMVLFAKYSPKIVKAAKKYYGLYEEKRYAKYLKKFNEQNGDPELARLAKMTEDEKVDDLPSGVDETPRSEVPRPEGEFESLPPHRQGFRDKNHSTFDVPKNITRDDEGYLEKTKAMRPAKNRRAIEVDNLAQKPLNDALPSSYVDALNNKFKGMLLKEFGQELERYPNIKVTLFSDYKSMRLLLEDTTGAKIPDELFRRLSERYTKVLDDYAKYLKDNKLIRSNEDPTLWFRAGVGNTADRATLAARWSRANVQDAHIGIFEDPKVEAHVRNGLQTTRAVEEVLMRRYPGLFDLEGPRAEVLSLARQIKIPAELRNILASRFNLDIFEETDGVRTKIKRFEVEDAMAWQDFANRLAQYSPSVLRAGNVKATLEGARYGGFTFDLRGQSGENLKAVANAIRSLIPNSRKSISKIDTETLVKTLRKKDMDATGLFEGRKREITAAIESVLGKGPKIIISGDDGTIIPNRPVTPQEQEDLFRALARVKGNGLRVTYVAPISGTVLAGQLDTLAQNGEKKEKAIRAQIEGVISHAKMQNIGFHAIAEDNQIKMGYNYRTDAPELELTDAEKRYIKSFTKLVGASY